MRVLHSLEIPYQGGEMKRALQVPLHIDDLKPDDLVAALL